MKSLNMKIGTQLFIGLAVMLFFVIVIGVVSYIQSGEIHSQTVTLYEHPIKVRRAVGEITSSVLSMRMDIRDLLLIEDAGIRQNILNDIAINHSKVNNEIANLRKWYLGQQKDIDNFQDEYIKWISIRAETIRILSSGKIEEARIRHLPGGIAPAQALKVLEKLEVISAFSLNKTEELYNNSKTLSKSLHYQLLLIVLTILFLTFIAYYYLIRSIRKPLSILTDVTRRFREGDMNARSNYDIRNEFGVLSDSYNDLADSIQFNTEINNEVIYFSSLMLSKFEPKEFFRETISALAASTQSQMAAIYLLNPDKNTFEHFESTGIDDNARQSFSADRFEGEFGSVLATREVHYMKNIPEDTRFVFHAVRGSMLPREIVTIPILTNNQIVAIISIASINAYSKQSIQLISRIYSTLCARVEGIMAYHKMKELSAMLENQNRELEAQKTELAGQSAELIEQNTELEMQKKQLDEASRLKTNFLSSMSHELRTPLNSVIALSGVLNRKLAKKIPDEEYSYLEIIERNGKNLLTLINDILDISRIESGKEEIEVATFSIGGLITEIVDMIKPQAVQNKIELIFSQSDLNLNITSDSHKCRHILQNIIGNAVKFTEKGKVEVKAVQRDNNLIVTVTDTGIGISEKHIPHIFDEFRQADGSTSRKFGGTGLGLAIAKKYANLLGGTISVKSVLEKGSEFTLTLPLKYKAENIIVDEHKIPEFKYAFKHNVSDPSVKTILLVEDSEPAIIQIKDFLEESGHKIIIARNGSEALRILSYCLPDAIILDLMMPGIDGFEVLKTIRDSELTANIPVMILTAKHITKEELGILKRNNIHQLIQKGDVNRVELLNAVSKMVSAQISEPDITERKIVKIEGKPSVLIVEDNTDNMTTVKALLGDNYTVIEAVNGDEAASLAKTHKPDMILMDIALPVIDGISAFKTIRKDPGMMHIPVIALTASAMTNDREAILSHGFDAYIAKPIDEKEFFKTINEVLYGK